MKIELENIDYRISGDSDYPAFDAILYISDRPAAKVHNEGYGCATKLILLGVQGRKLTEEAELYCKTLPHITYPENDFFDHSCFTIPVTLLTQVDEIFKDHLRKKEFVGYELGRLREMNKSLIWSRGTDSYSSYTFPIPLAKLLANPGAHEIIIAAIRRIQPMLRPGGTNPEHQCA